METAEDASVEAVVSGLEYDVLDANAEAFDEFLERWYASVSTPGRKLDIEAHARGMRATSLCHVDGVADRAVAIYVDVQRLLAELLKRGPEELHQLADTPEADVTPEQRDEVDRRAAALRALA